MGIFGVFGSGLRGVMPDTQSTVDFRHRLMMRRKDADIVVNSMVVEIMGMRMRGREAGQPGKQRIQR